MQQAEFGSKSQGNQRILMTSFAPIENDGLTS